MLLLLSATTLASASILNTFKCQYANSKRQLVNGMSTSDASGWASCNVPANVEEVLTVINQCVPAGDDPHKSCRTRLLPTGDKKYYIKKCFDTVDCSGSHYLKEEWEESRCRDALFSNRTGNFDDSDNTKVADMKIQFDAAETADDGLMCAEAYDSTCSNVDANFAVAKVPLNVCHTPSAALGVVKYTCNGTTPSRESFASALDCSNGVVASTLDLSSSCESFNGINVKFSCDCVCTSLADEVINWIKENMYIAIAAAAFVFSVLLFIITCCTIFVCCCCCKKRNSDKVSAYSYDY